MVETSPFYSSIKSLWGMQGHGDSCVERDTDGWQVIKCRALSSTCGVLEGFKFMYQDAYLLGT